MLAAPSDTSIALLASASDSNTADSSSDDYSLLYVAKPIAQNWPTTDPGTWNWTTWNGQFTVDKAGQDSWLSASFPRQSGYDYAFVFTVQDSIGNHAQSSIVYCNEGYGTGDIIPVDLNSAIPADVDPGATRQFTLQGIDFYDPSSGATTPLVPVAPSSGRSDLLLTYPGVITPGPDAQPMPVIAPNGQPEVAYIVFSQRAEETVPTPTDTGPAFSDTGRFYFAPPTLDGLPYDEFPDTSYATRGYSGQFQVQFQVTFEIAPGQTDVQSFSTIIRVNPGFSQTGDAAVVTGEDLTLTMSWTPCCKSCGPSSG